METETPDSPVPKLMTRSMAIAEMILLTVAQELIIYTEVPAMIHISLAEVMVRM